MKLTIALLLVSIPLLVAGGEGLYHAARSRQQTVISCDQLSEPPRALWVKLSGCHLDYDVGTSFTQKDGQITELAFPVRSSPRAAATAPLVVATTRDPAVLAIAQPTIGNGQRPTPDAYTVMMLRIVTALHAARDVDGTVRRGLLNTWRTRKTLSSLNTPVAPGAAILDLNERPEVQTPAIVTGVGMAVLLSAVALGMRRRHPSATGAPVADVAPAFTTEEGEPAPLTTLVPAAAPSRAGQIRGLMLLNLPPSAGPEAIEHASPLGPRQTVEQQIEGILPGIRFDDRGRGSVTLPDVKATIDLGAGDVTWTAVVDAAGDGAAEAVHAIISGTGWRAYAPKRGTFVEANDLDQA